MIPIDESRQVFKPGRRPYGRASRPFGRGSPLAAPKAGSRKILKVLAVIAVFLILIVVLLPELIPTGWIKDLVIKEIRTRLNRDAEIKSISLGWFKGVGINGLTVYEPGNPHKPFVRLKRLELRATIFGLIALRVLRPSGRNAKTPKIEKIVLVEPEVFIIKYKDGRYNFSDLIARRPESKNTAMLLACLPFQLDPGGRGHVRSAQCELAPPLQFCYSDFNVCFLTDTRQSTPSENSRVSTPLQIPPILAQNATVHYQDQATNNQLQIDHLDINFTDKYLILKIPEGNLNQGKIRADIEVDFNQVGAPGQCKIQVKQVRFAASHPLGDPVGHPNAVSDRLAFDVSHILTTELLPFLQPLLSQVKIVQVETIFSAQFDLSSWGLEWDDYKKNLKGKGEIIIEGGQLQGLSVLKLLAKKLNNPLLARIKFDRMKQLFEIRDERVWNYSTDFSGKEAEVHLVGWTGFDGKLYQVVTFRGELEERWDKKTARILKAINETGGLKVRGTIQNPKIELAPHLLLPK